MSSNPMGVAMADGGLGPASPSRYIISHSGPMGVSRSQQSAAAAFFARNRSKSATTTAAAAAAAAATSANGSQSRGRGEGESAAPTTTVTDFSSILSKCPPPAPSHLLRRIVSSDSDCDEGQNNNSSSSRVKVVLRVANSGLIDEERSYFRMDKARRQVTLTDPSCLKSDSTAAAVAAPKVFAFDAVFTDEDAQVDVASAAVSDAIVSAIRGLNPANSSSCIFCFGHSGLGKSYTMVGSDESAATVGVVGAATAWLFRCLAELRSKKKSKVSNCDGGDIDREDFSVRVSAAEIVGGGEEVKDLLADHPDAACNPPAPTSYLPRSPSSILSGLTELHCSSADRAGHYLDSALTFRKCQPNYKDSLQTLGTPTVRPGKEDSTTKDSHLIFTLHIYRHAGSSRIHIIDFGGFERTKTASGSMTLSALGHLLLSTLGGQQRPGPANNKEEKSSVTKAVRECMGSTHCQAVMLAHVSPAPSHFSETLHTTQFASRLHRMRRRKIFKSANCSGGGEASKNGSGGSSDETRRRMRIDHLSSTTDPSSSEQSCDTVIYVGNSRGAGDETDAEHPPVFLPSLNSDDGRGVMSRALRGTGEGGATNSSGGSRGSTLERRKNSKKRLSSASKSPVGTILKHRSRPGSVGSTPTRASFGGVNSAREGCPLTTTTTRRHTQQQLMLGLSRGGSLPRAPKGKMPLHGRVAGHRQGGGGVSGGSSGADSVGSVGELWVDQPQVLKAQSHEATQLLRQIGEHFGGSKGGSVDTNAYNEPSCYGYMDDHKKSMIQRWVESQIIINSHRKSHNGSGGENKKMVPVKAPPEISVATDRDQTMPEPFAWLKDGAKPNDGDESSCCKVLTQFKTAESSDDSLSDQQPQQPQPQPQQQQQQVVCVVADVHPDNNEGNDDEDSAASPVPPSPAVSSVSPPEVDHLKEEEEEEETETQEKAEDLSSSSPSAKKSKAVTLAPENCAALSDLQHSLTPDKKKSKFSPDKKGEKGITALPGEQSGRRQSLDGSDGQQQQLPHIFSTASPFRASTEPKSISTSATTTSPNNNDRWRSSNIHGGVLGLARGGPLRGDEEEPEEEEEEEEFLLVEKSVGNCSAARIEVLRASNSEVVQKNVADNASEVSSLHSMGLSPVVELTESSDNNQATALSSSSFSDDSCSKLSSLDAKLLHYVSKGKGRDVKVVDAAASDNFFDQRFDQLAKLHDLYASVSSISAKSQQRRNMGAAAAAAAAGTNNVLSSTLSLGAAAEENSTAEGRLLSNSTLSLGGAEIMLFKHDRSGNNNNNINNNEDVNSLCSEPVKMPDFSDISRSDLDLNFLCNNPHQSSISLSELGYGGDNLDGAFSLGVDESFPPPPPPIAQPMAKASATTAPATGACPADRSDSPVLEGIDRELAKYAKLKDLKKAYEKGPEKRGEDEEKGILLLPPMPPTSSTTQKPSSSSSSSSCPPPKPKLCRSDHVPDGASNPDLNAKHQRLCCTQQQNINGQQRAKGGSACSSSHSSSSSSSDGNGKLVHVQPEVPRRSPGTGQSSCSSDDASTSRMMMASSSSPAPASRMIKQQQRRQQQQQISNPSSGKIATVNKRPLQRQNRQNAANLAEDGGEAIWKERPAVTATKTASTSNGEASKKNESKKTVVPRFSRLFSSATKKISKSPLKIGGGRDEKKRQSSSGSGSNSNNNKNFPEVKSGIKEKKKEGQTSLPGTLEKRSGAARAGRSHQHDLDVMRQQKGFFSVPKNAKGTPSQVANKNSSNNKHLDRDDLATLLPSPYSFPSSAQHPHQRRGANGARCCETSSNDSGLGGATVRMRQGRGAKSSSHSYNQQQNSQKSTRAKHCRSSGYESSLESPTVLMASSIEVAKSDREEEEAEGEEVVELTLCDHLNQLPPLPLLTYDLEKVHKMDDRWHQCAVSALKSQQERLKDELALAKGRIGADPSKWSYELHVHKTEESFCSRDKSSFVEALASETNILRKRVDACRAHVRLDTCFDVNLGGFATTLMSSPSSSGPPPPSQSCCTTECDFAEDIMLSLDDKAETDIF